MAKLNPRYIVDDNSLSSVDGKSSFLVRFDTEKVFTKTQKESDADFGLDPRRKTNREIAIKKELLELHRKESDISRVYKETLRAVIHLFSDLFVIDSDDNLVKISCAHGHPERVIAKLKQESNIILPVITVTQSTSDNDDNRRKFTPILVNERYWDTDKHRAYRIVSFAPRPVNINYSINFWTKYMADMDQMLEQSRLKFNPDAAINTPFSTKTKAFITEEVDNSELTPGDTAERILRKTLNISVEGYIPSPKFLYSSTGKIEKLKAEAVLHHIDKRE